MMTPEQQASKIVHAYALDLGPGRYDFLIFDIAQAIRAAAEAERAKIEHQTGYLVKGESWEK